MNTRYGRFTVGLVTPVPPPNGGMAVQGQKLGDRLINEGVRVRLFATNPKFPAFFQWAENISGIRTVIRFWIYIINLIKIKNVDLVHIFGASYFFFFASVAPAILFGKVYKKEIIIHYHGGEADKFFLKFKKVVLPFLKIADIIAVPSEFLSRIFQKHFGMNTRILPNIADFDQFSFRKRDRFGPKIVVTRHLEAIYGHRTILKAFALIKKDYPAAVLRIAGDGSLREELEAFAVKLGLSGVEFLGMLSQQELSQVYDKSDIMVNASIVDNFPGTLIEAFLCGLPVVSSAAGGIPWMIRDGENGFLFDAEDEEALADGVRLILTDNEQAQKIVVNARKFPIKYSWPSVCEKLFELYGIKPKDTNE